MMRFQMGQHGPFQRGVARIVSTADHRHGLERISSPKGQHIAQLADLGRDDFGVGAPKRYQCLKMCPGA